MISRIDEHRTLATLLLVSALAFGLGACAHTPNPNLVQAEQELRAAETDPIVTANAPLLLEDARQALERGQRAWRNGEDEDEVDHLAYVAARRVEIARLSAQQKADAERAEELSRERDPLVVVTPPPAQAPATVVVPAPREKTVVVPTPREKMVVVPSPREVPPSRVEEVFFGPERFSLPEGSRLELGRAADLIVAHPSLRVRVEGHADDTERDPLGLSLQRAEQVAQELIALGVEPDRVAVRGLGAEAAAASSLTPSGRQRNRRVEIVLTSAR